MVSFTDGRCNVEITAVESLDVIVKPIKISFISKLWILQKKIYKVRATAYILFMESANLDILPLHAAILSTIYKDALEKHDTVNLQQGLRYLHCQ